MPGSSNSRLGSGATGGLDTARVMAALNAALEGSQFRDSQRQSALLRYIVTQECEGHGEKLNAYAIAFDVFDRDSSFNPAIDSIVRVEMHRLRSNLNTWNELPANRAFDRIEIRPRSYRPIFIEAALPEESPAPVPVRPKRRYLILAGLVAVLLVATGLIVRHQHRVAECSSARPELFLPREVRSATASVSLDVIRRLKEMLQYYPLVTVIEEGNGICDGVPQYDLALTQGNGSLNSVVTVHAGNDIVLNDDVPFLPAGSQNDRNIAAARIAYRIAHDAGAVPLDALRRDWSGTPASEQFRCLMRAHQFFMTHTGPSIYPKVRECLIREFRTATKADVPAMLAALELEPVQSPNLRQFQPRNYYTEAIQAASRLDTYNSELNIVQLREIRLNPQKRRGDAQIIANMMDRLYPYEPNVRNQISFTQCKLTQEYDAGLKNIDLAMQISEGNFGLPFAGIYCNLALGKPHDNLKYVEELLGDTSPFIVLIALETADAENDRVLIAKALNRLNEMNCGTRACVTNAAKEGAVNPDISFKLDRLIDRYFPR